MADRRARHYRVTKADDAGQQSNAFALQDREYREYRRRPSWIPWAAGLVALALVSVVLLAATSSQRLSTWIAEPDPPATPVFLNATQTPTPVEVAEVAGEEGEGEQVAGEATLTGSGDSAVAAVSTPLAPAVPPQLPTPTLEPDGQVLTINSRRSSVGWWVSGDTPQAFVGDSFLYSGFGDRETYVAAAQFELARVPRGAAIHNAKLMLTGLRDDMLDRSQNTSWLVQLVAEEALPELAGSDFSAVFNAPASITLSPELPPESVGAGTVNEWTLDENARNWLFQQLVDGATTVTVRILPFNVGSDSLFAWDSGGGSESKGNAPALVLRLGAPPAIPPPTATRPFLIATLTPIPENVLTVVAQAAVATSEVAAGGGSTPTPVEIITPTPLPENLATVQVAAAMEGLPPVVLHTPVPANAATATAISDFATAVALTTGTFTPVPTNFVTPAIYYPPPPPENVATAAARVLYATAVASRGGTPTPTRPWNAVPAVYVYATATPANTETAIAEIRERNASVVTNGTSTPTPWNLVVITEVPEPTVTPIPLVVSADSVTPTPSPTTRPELSATTLDEFRGKILFLSDRGGSTQTWVMEPSTGEVLALVTDERVHTLARERFLPLSADGNRRAYVAEDSDRELQIFVEDLRYDKIEQVSHQKNCCGGEATSYDPAWSPVADVIAYVSTASDGDEIYVQGIGQPDPVRLTFNSWEWDKHPTWSPDGRQIAFFSNRETGRTQIWVMYADGSGQRNLSNNEYSDWDPVWVR